MNDTYGHIEGDTLLHEVGKVLRSSFRESDVLGRVGGDEFLLLLKTSISKWHWTSWNRSSASLQP